MEPTEATGKNIFVADYDQGTDKENPQFALKQLPRQTMQKQAIEMGCNLHILDYARQHPQKLAQAMAAGGIAFIHAMNRPDLMNTIEENLQQPLVVVFVTGDHRCFEFGKVRDETRCDGKLVFLHMRSRTYWHDGRAFAQIIKMSHQQAEDLANGKIRPNLRPLLFTHVSGDLKQDLYALAAHRLLNDEPITKGDLKYLERLFDRTMPDGAATWSKPLDILQLHKTCFPELAKEIQQNDPSPLAQSETRHLFIIWNDDSYCMAMQRGFSKNPDKATTVTHPKLITSRQALEQSDLFKKVGRRLQRASLIILVELDWENTPMSTGLGYQILEELITMGFRGNVLFFSTLSRSQLCAPPTATYAKLFPHHKLHGEKIEWKKLKIPTISLAKWEFITRYYLDAKGLLNKLVHDLNHRRHTNVEGIRQYNTYLRSLVGLLPHEISHAIEDQVMSSSVPAYIDSLMEKLNDHIKTLNNDRLEAIEDGAKPRLMIVEDNPEFLKALTEGLGHTFEIKRHNVGAEALKELKAHPKDYAAVLLDMELLSPDQSHWQTIQGIDLLEFVVTLPWIAVIGLSQLSRMAITTSAAFDAVRIIPKATTIQHQLPEHVGFADLAADILNMIDAKRELRDAGFPTTGPWIRDGLLYFFHKLKSAGRLETQILQTVTQDVERFLKHYSVEKPVGKPTLLDPQMFRDSFLERLKGNYCTEEYLRRILAHRLVCLQYQKNHLRGIADYETIKSAIREINPQDSKDFSIGYDSIKKYISTDLGFRYAHGLDAGLRAGEWRILNEELFDHERQWLERGTDNYQAALERIVDYIKEGLSDADFLANGCLKLTDPLAFLKSLSNTYKDTKSMSHREDIEDEIDFADDELRSAKDFRLLESCKDECSAYHQAYMLLSKMRP